MKIAGDFDKIVTGVLSGIILPFITAGFIFLFSKGSPEFHVWLVQISVAGIQTHIVTLSVFSNIIIFLLFNHFDMLRAAKGVLGATIAWAIFVFSLKLFL